MTAKIEPWMRLAASVIADEWMRNWSSDTLSMRIDSIAAIIAGHAPEQEPIDAYCPKCSELLMLHRGTAIKEPSIPVSRLKFAIATSANLRGDQLTNDIIYLIHEAEGEK